MTSEARGTDRTIDPRPPRSLLLSRSASRWARIAAATGQGLLFLVTAFSAASILFIFYFIIRDALPFFQLRGITEFLTTKDWYPSGTPPHFGALAIFFGSGLVTLGAVVVAVPMGIAAAVCLSDVLPFTLRQAVKPVIEILAAIPSVAYGFFALVVLAPMLQSHGGPVLAVAAWCVGTPLVLLMSVVAGDLAASRFTGARTRILRYALTVALAMLGGFGLWRLGAELRGLDIDSGTNALNVSLILGIMALPTIVSVSEDALQATGRDLREGSYALGATRAETIVKVIIPAASSGILAAVILGVMRAIGETMVVWMASGNAAQIPDPWYNVLQPVRTLTATIAGDMGEADHVMGSARYHVLFAMAAGLLLISFLCNLASEHVRRRTLRGIEGT
ncbi:phosphate ABC transporter permease subunit PstC [Candidatus Fermentibacteria bacterium]|nr:phosphate ABC transporter permease subunit PstC [Candidatus Fermentibacteria bacterium]